MAATAVCSTASSGRKPNPGPEVMNVRTIRILASGRARPMGHRPPRRPDRRRCEVETLEVRGLLSAVTAIRSTFPDGPDGYRSPVAEIATTVASHPAVHATSSDNDADERAHTPSKSSASSYGAEPAVARITPTASGGIRRLTSQDVSSRTVPGPASAGARGVELGTWTTTANASLIDPYATSAALGDESDGVPATSVVGWGQASGASPGGSNSTGAAQGPGQDGRSADGPVASAASIQPSGTVALLVSWQEAGVSASDADRPTPESEEDAANLSSAESDAPDREGQGTTWAEVLEGSLCPDWESVDGELRRFLARLGGGADRPVVSDPWPLGRLWIAAAVALALGSRASAGRRRLFRRPVLGAAWAPVRRPVPIGPWPLGPP
jgi:hypothetical protein